MMYKFGHSEKAETPLPLPLIWTLSRKSLFPKRKIRIFNMVDTSKKDGPLMVRDDMSYNKVFNEHIPL